MRELTHLSLFTGIGGIDIAAEWAGFNTIGQCEYADFPYRLLEKRFPDVPRWRDVCKLTSEDIYERTKLRTVDLISGGYPCQPFSVAGKRQGSGDDRYLWTEMFRLIKELRPAFVLGENVAGHISLGLDATLFDLERTGYKARTFVIPACAVQAPHERARVIVVAYDTARGFGKWKRDEKCGVSAWSDTECERICRFISDTDGMREQQPQGCKQESGRRTCDGCQENRILPNTVGVGRASVNDEIGELQQTLSQAPERESSGAGSTFGIPDTASVKLGLQRSEEEISRSCGERRYSGSRVPRYDSGEWWSVEPGVGRVAHGIPDRVDRLKGLGNAVVPYQVYPVLEAIAKILREEQR